MIKQKDTENEEPGDTNIGELEIYEIPEINASYEQKNGFLMKAEILVKLFRINETQDIGKLIRIFSEEIMIQL